MMMNAGVSPDEKDYHDYTPLHYAVILGWLNACKILLDAGADINAPTAAGKTALMLAVEFDRDEILEYFLSRTDLHIDAADTDGYTALIYAVVYNFNVAVDIDIKSNTILY